MKFLTTPSRTVENMIGRETGHNCIMKTQFLLYVSMQRIIICRYYGKVLKVVVDPDGENDNTKDSTRQELCRETAGVYGHASDERKVSDAHEPYLTVTA